MPWLTLALVATVARGASPTDLRDACIDGDAQACQALMPARSERWALLEEACVGGVGSACMALARASSDDLVARDPRRATAWVQAACDAGHQDSCTRVQAARSPLVELRSEGIYVDGVVQVRFSGDGRWTMTRGSREGATIKPVFGVLRAWARDHGLDRADALVVPLELRIDPRAPVELVQELLYSASQAGWRSFRMGGLSDREAQLVDAWLPSLGTAAPLSPVAQAAAAARPGGGVVQGTVASEDVQQGLRQGQPMLQACWERAVAIDPHQGGRVEVRLVIGSDGAVNDAAIRASELNNPQLEACIAEAFEAMRFAAPGGGGIATIDYPMVLEPVWAEPSE